MRNRGNPEPFDRNNELDIKQIQLPLKDYLKQQNWYTRLEEGKSVSAYNKLEDKFIQEHSKACYSDNGELLIQVDSPIVAHEIKMRSSSLIQSINQKMGFNAIQRLRFQIEEAHKLKRHDSTHEKTDNIANKKTGLSNEDLKSIKAMAQNIEDNTIKKQVIEWFKYILKKEIEKNQQEPHN